MLIFGVVCALFADSPDVPDGFGYVVATVAGGLGAKLIEMIGARDKLKYDSRIVALETGVRECHEKHAECESAHSESLNLIETLRREMRERDERDKAEMRAEIEELRREQRGESKGDGELPSPVI